MRRTIALALPLLICGFAPQEGKTSTGLLSDGVRLETEARSAAVTVAQLTAEIAKVDLQLAQLEAERRRLEKESEISEATKDRLAPRLTSIDDRRKPLEAQKARLDRERSGITERRLLERALDAYTKAADKAAADGKKDVLANALLGVGRMNEISIPENLGAAQAAYARVVAECAGQGELVAAAEEKIRLKGVDVYLDQFARFVDGWRSTQRNTPAPLEAKKVEIAAKVKPLGRDAVHGLLAGLGHKDEVVRAFAADLLAGAIDEAGLGNLVAKLNDPSPDVRAGAGLAIGRIFEAWSQARSFEQEAEKILADLEAKEGSDATAEKLIALNKNRAQDLQKRAAEIRGNLPVALGNKAQIEAELQKLIADESAHSASRIEAAKAVRALGEISGGLIDAVLKGLSSANRSVREACCVAASGVDTSDSAAKHKLVDRLMEIVQYEPESDTRPMSERDLANDSAVREAGATSLGVIGVVKAVPALIEALSDGASNVRRTANEALVRITGRDVGYESDPLVAVSGGPDAPRPSPEDVAKAQKAKRDEAIAKWTAWWGDTMGVGVLIGRFWKFQSQWKGGDPARLFDKESYLRELKIRSYTLSDPAAQIERAERNCDRFLVRKNFIQQDAIDLGAAAIDKFLGFLSGAVEADAALAAEQQGRSRAVVRVFVAETVAKLIEKHKAADKAGALREKLGGGQAGEKAGAALALGFLPKDLVGAEDRDALEKRGLEDADPEVKEAAARALGRVGGPESGPALAKVAAANAGTKAGETAQISALRSIAALAPKSEEVVRTLGDLVGVDAEKRSPSSAVREFACEALAAIADPAAVQNRSLLKARRDIAKPVRDAATRALLAVAAGAPDTVDVLIGVLNDLKAPSIDRTGAGLGLGDLGNPKGIPALVYRIVGRNPPLADKDEDPTVRAACCEALATMGEKARYLLVGEKLIDALDDPAEEVQRQAFEALVKAAPSAPEEGVFKITDPTSARKAGIAKLRTWLDTNRGQWKELSQ
jgi:HEAT repeat protein